MEEARWGRRANAGAQPRPLEIPATLQAAPRATREQPQTQPSRPAEEGEVRPSCRPTRGPSCTATLAHQPRPSPAESLLGTV